MNLRRALIFLWLGPWLLSLQAAPHRKSAAPSWPQVRTATFDLVWNTVNDTYFDPTFGGTNWTYVGMRYRAELPAARDNQALRILLQRMLGELQRSHFAILPKEMTVFTPEEREARGEIGVVVGSAGGAVVIVRVENDSAAMKAGLRSGDVIIAIDEVKVADLVRTLTEAGVEESRRSRYLQDFAAARLQAPPGKELRLVVRRGEDGEKTYSIAAERYAGDWSEPVGYFPSIPLRREVRKERDGAGYMRFNVFAPGVMKEFRALLRTLQPQDGLILDLRGNPGGLMIMAAGISGWLFDREVLIGRTRSRRGPGELMAYPQEGAFLGPLAVLIDNGSASASEILAAGLKETGRARIFGERSAGATLQSLVRALPTGDLLQYAVGDVQTAGGTEIERKGVVPDEIVTCSQDDLMQGRDPVLDAARAWLAGQRNVPAKK